MRGLIGLVSLCLVAGAALPASAQSPLERGRYLVEVLGACGNCHTPKGPEGDLPGKHLAGGFQLDDTFGTWITPNITPDPERDLRAIIAYLRSLPPIRNKVSAPESPKKP